MQETYDYCVSDMRLKGSDLLYGIPVVMDTSDESFAEGQKVALRYEGKMIGVLEIESKWVPNKPLEALKCYGTSSLEHPGVQMISMERGKYYLGGKVGRVGGGRVGQAARIAALPLRISPDPPSPNP